MTPDPRRLPPRLDIDLDGTIRPTGGNSRPRLSTRVGLYATVAAVFAGAVLLATVALWLALTLVPIVIGAAIVAWVAFRIRAWQTRSGPPARRQ